MPKNTAAQSVASSMSVSFKEVISPEEVVKIFHKEADWQPWTSHLDVFFGELPPPLIQRFMAENNLSFDQLSAIHDVLPPVRQSRQFKEMRDAAIGQRKGC